MEILYGRNTVLETLRAGRRKIASVAIEESHRDQELIARLKQLKIPFESRSQKEMTSLAGSGAHQGLVAQVESYRYAELDLLMRDSPSPALFVVCDSVQDPQNLGTLCRSAFCFGAAGVILPKDRSAEVTPAVVRASAGTTEHLPIAQVVNVSRTLEEFKKRGFWIYGADMGGGDFLEKISFDSKSVVVVGSEGEGIRPLVLSKCDFIFRIRTDRPFDSLNVAQAASIILYEVSRQRMGKKSLS